MKKPKTLEVLSRLIALSLLLSMFSGILVMDVARAAARNDANVNRNASLRHRKVAQDVSEARIDSSGSVKVILQLNDRVSVGLAALLRGNGVHVKRHFQAFNTISVELPPTVVDSLAAFSEVEFVSVDAPVRSFGGHVAHTTGTDNVRERIAGTSLNGEGIGIAIMDSGIYPNHVAFLDQATNRSRIIANVDFTAEGRTDDPYGHGTHVASAAAGNGMVANARFIGIAPKANLINLRVLNSQGLGSVSAVLSAMEWVLTNHARYNIRVVNMSFGMPAINSYRIDPLCLAARRLVDAGIVVVAAAGNNGKQSNGEKVYGQLHSPGNEPSVITVGAVDTKGTDNRADDGIATYSSRGPSRSYWTDENGLRHYDNLIKPEIAAPGNKLVFAKSPNCKLALQNPSLNVPVSADPTRAQMILSGTSMASPVVAGSAALLLQANPNLTPNLIKMILMYTAQQLPAFNMLEQGSGELNVDGAVKLARLVRPTSATTSLGSSLLTVTIPPKPVSSISYGHSRYTFTWAQGIVLGNTFATGVQLISKYQKIYAEGVLLSDGVLISDGVLVSDASLLSNGVLLGDGVLVSDGTVMGNGGVFLPNGVLIGDGVLLSDGVLLGDGVLVSDGVLISDGVLLADAVLQAQSALTGGDPTATMASEIDLGVNYLGY
jgi:subtilisin family serine protease